MNTTHNEIRVIAVGNPLQRDDGVGLAILERLRERPWPETVQFMDGGTGGVDLLRLMEGAGQVILVDAVEMGKSPGTVERFLPRDVQLVDSEGRGLSLHQAGLAEVLVLGSELDILPPLVIFGVQPEQVAPGTGLSPKVAAAVEATAASITAELATLVSG